MRRLLLILSISVCGLLKLCAQHTAIKTNLPYWATATINVAAETKVADKWTAEISAGLTPFTFSDNKNLTHFVVQPEARYWLCSPYAGHFVGAHVLYSHYNAGGVKLPFGLFPDLENHRFQGDLGAVGVLYGYSWMLPGKHWSLEGVIGLGYGITRYDKYSCAKCGGKVGTETKHLFMPTKLALNLVYYIK